MVGKSPLSAALSSALAELRNGQQEAVSWGQGALLVLAGPGSGKTTVLTTRIARLISESPGKFFRVLALTFTNKAAAEMRARLEQLIPDATARANVGTFHWFCADVLRTHGSRLKLTPDFTVYPTVADQLEVMQGVLQESDSWLEPDQALRTINHLRANLLTPEEAERVIEDPALAADVRAVYSLYNERLLQLNALDFDGLLYFAVKLFQRYPKLTEHYRRVYSYWCIDEFQDTNLAQFELLRAMAGGVFRDIFAVADDDQVLYEWNGASHLRLVDFQREFQAERLQLPTNFRCPKSVVELANQLIVRNSLRMGERAELRAARSDAPPVAFLEAEDEDDQAHQVAQAIQQRGLRLDEVAILARSNRQLEVLQSVLQGGGIAVIKLRRQNDFVSPALRFLVAALKLSVERGSPRKWQQFVKEYQHLQGLVVDEVAIQASAVACQGDVLFAFCQLQRQNDTWLPELLEAELLGGDFRTFIADYLDGIRQSARGEDFEEDERTWMALEREILQACGSKLSVPRFLQELDLRSKEPPRPPTPHVQLLTIHASKGKEFDHVFLVGLAETSFPSYQAVQAGDESSAMEEERRSCYVAITRTRQTLTLAYPRSMNGYARQPSRFLRELGFVE